MFQLWTLTVLAESSKLVDKFYILQIKVEVMKL